MEQRPPLLAPPRLERPADMPPLRFEPPRPTFGSLLKNYLGLLAVVGILLLKWGAKLKFLIGPILKFFPPFSKPAAPWLSRLAPTPCFMVGGSRWGLCS